MKIENMTYRKVIKILSLLITSALIATVSAATYKYMYIDGSVTISTTTGLKWVEGSDAPSGTSIAGSTVTLPLSVQNGTPINFTYCLYLQNLDTTANHSLLISVTNDANTTLYDEFNIFIFNNASGSYIDTINVLTTDSCSGSILTSEVWRLTFEVAAKASASGTDTFDIQVRYE
ncbi:hypothetical protein KEJ15_07430 [Candidatus Bathyarchaeota archaeon]|nr:hypothetical protein [Candidatus Bathyarchaeota archaeon]